MMTTEKESLTHVISQVYTEHEVRGDRIESFSGHFRIICAGHSIPQVTTFYFLHPNMAPQM